MTDDTKTTRVTLSLPQRIVNALNAMVKEDETESLSGLVAKLVEPATEYWYETGRRIGREDLKRDVTRARLKKAEAVARLATVEAAALRKELGEDDSPAVPAARPAMTVDEFLAQMTTRQPDALLPRPASAVVTQFRVNATRAGLDPDACLAAIPAYRQRLAREWEERSRARQAERDRAMEARPR